jgi:hypothetical protein
MEMVKAWGGLTVTCVQLALAIFGYAVVWQLHYNILGLFAPFYFLSISWVLLQFLHLQSLSKNDGTE